VEVRKGSRNSSFNTSMIFSSLWPLANLISQQCASTVQKLFNTWLSW